MADASKSKRQKKLADAKDRNMTRGQLWRARQRKQKGKDISSLRGGRCILVVTNRGRERIGTTEAIAILELDELDQDGSSDDDDEGKQVDLQAALAKELEQARATSNKTYRYDIAMPCLAAIKCDDDPVALVSKLFDAVIAEGKARSTHVEKLIPLQLTCYPTIEAITSAAKPLLVNASMFLANAGSNEATPENSKTFSIIVKIRGTIHDGKNVGRMDIIKAVAALVDETKHKVDLTNPDVIVLIEVVRSVAGVSVVSGDAFRKYRKYNLRALTDEGADGDD